jgi:hypothetical protein
MDYRLLWRRRRACGAGDHASRSSTLHAYGRPASSQARTTSVSEESGCGADKAASFLPLTLPVEQSDFRASRGRKLARTPHTPAVRPDVASAGQPGAWSGKMRRSTGFLRVTKGSLRPVTREMVFAMAFAVERWVNERFAKGLTHCGARRVGSPSVPTCDTCEAARWMPARVIARHARSKPWRNDLRHQRSSVAILDFTVWQAWPSPAPAHTVSSCR